MDTPLKHKKLISLLLLAFSLSFSAQGQTVALSDSLATAVNDSLITAMADTIPEVSIDTIATTATLPVAEQLLPVKPSPIDSIAEHYEQQFDLLRYRYKHYQYSKADTLANPYYFYIFARPTYYSAPIHALMGLTANDSCQTAETKGALTPTPLLNNIYQNLSEVYAHAPQLIRHEENWAESGIRSDVNHEVKPEVKLTEKVEEKAPTIVDDYQADDWNIVVHKPNFWTFKANVGLQLMQYFVSDNWHKGGESHFSWLATSVIEANYNNKQKLTFDNKLEMRLGFQSTKEDKTHKYRSNTDQIRLTNKLGLKATKHWYYTLMLQSWTQFYPGYKQNDEKVYSDFMSPFESVITLGMDYKLDLKKFNMSATISPFAGNLKYVDRKALAPSFGVKENHHSKFDFGSNLTLRYNWNIAKNISLSGRLFYFTDYETTRVEWENTFNLVINKYLSTKIYLYPRFDDGVTRKEGDSYFQFQETLSLGFNFNF